MKRIFLSALAAAPMFIATQNVSAQEVKADEVEVVQQVAEFVQLDVAELPVEVTQAFERDYPEAEISEAYVKEEKGEKKFKLVVTTAEGEVQELYADAKGNWIEAEVEG